MAAIAEVGLENYARVVQVPDRFVSGEGRYYIRVFPHKSVTSIPAETRMGKGKGEPEYWTAVVKTGQVICVVQGSDSSGV